MCLYVYVCVERERGAPLCSHVLMSNRPVVFVCACVYVCVCGERGASFCSHVLMSNRTVCTCMCT